MAGTANASWQQYSRWMWVITRSFKMNEPKAADNISYNLVGVAQPHVFTIGGNWAANFKAGFGFTVQGSAANALDGFYTCSIDATFAPIPNLTTITVVTVIPAGAVGAGLVVTGEEAMLASVIEYFWNTDTSTGSRPWLYTWFDERSAMPENTPPNKPGYPPCEPTYNDIKNLGVIARDIKKIPLTDAEKIVVDALFGATGNRKYGYKANII
jgi:hypothetical protein